MLGPEGLLTHLRIAIVHNDISLTKDIAELCSFHANINMRRFHRQIGIVLLQHKFPEGKTLFKVVEERLSKARNNLKGDTVKAKRFVEVAVAAAKLKTNHAPFEKAFIALFQASQKNPLVLPPWQHFESTASVKLYEDVYNAQLPKSSGTLLIDDEQHNGLRKSIFHMSKKDKFKTSLDGEEPKAVSFASFSDDFVLKQVWMEMLDNDSVGHSVYDSMSHFVPRSYQTEVESVLKANEVLQSRQKILTGANLSNISKLLFPDCSDTFNSYMETFLKENKLYFLTSHKPFFQSLRTECRHYYATLNNLTVEGVKYGCRYLQKMKSHWLLQLVLPLHTDKTVKEKLASEEYPLLGKMYELGFPEALSFSPPKCLEIPEGCVFRVVKKTAVDRLLSDKTVQRWYVKEHVKTRQLRWKTDLDKPDMNLALLQLLVVRFYKGMATTYADIRVHEEEKDLTLVMLDEKVKPPNRKHPDVWYQLFYIDTKRNKVQRNYYYNIIEALKDYLRGYGGLDQAFFQWGKNHYGDKFSVGLFPKMMTSLSAKNANGKRPAHALVEEDLGIATIRGQSQASV